MKNENLSRKNCNVTMKTLPCVVCGIIFTQNKLAYLQKTCSDKCSKINKNNRQVKKQNKVRKEFREKNNIPSSRIFAEFVYNQDILDENPTLKEALQLIVQITHHKVSKDEKLKAQREYMREYRLKKGIKPRNIKNKSKKYE